LTLRGLAIVPFSAFMKATCSAGLLRYEVLYCYVSRCGFLSLVRSAPFGPSWAEQWQAPCQHGFHQCIHGNGRRATGIRVPGMSLPRDAAGALP
jgi:hypothetical protein